MDIKDQIESSKVRDCLCWEKMINAVHTQADIKVWYLSLDMLWPDRRDFKNGEREEVICKIHGQITRTH